MRIRVARRPSAGSMVPPRLSWLLASVLLAGGVAGLVSCDEPTATGSSPRRMAVAGDDSGPPSLVLISLDTTRADRMGCYGYRGGTTPNIDRWAREGVVFETVVTPVPVTLPAHASLMTGLLPERHGVHDNGLHRLPEGPATLAGILSAGGYDTAAVVAAAVLDRQYGIGRGFAHYDDRVSGGGLAIAERNAEAVTEAALAAAASLRRPYFLFVHYFDPHADYRAPPPFAERFPGAPYDAEIAYADHAIGGLRSGLEQLGLLNGTVVAITADHGEGLGEHGELTHGVFLYDSTLRVPLIVAAPGRLPAGERTGCFGRLIDVAPTLLDLLGLPAPDGLDGRSILTSLTGEDECPLDSSWGRLESEFGYNAYGWSPLRGLTNGRLKWVGAPQPELYDLVDDPGEKRNLAGERPEDEARLAGLWRAEAPRARRAPEPGDGSLEDRALRLERLRGLGYVPATGRPSPAGRALPDPKTMVATLDSINRARELLASGEHDEAIATLRSVLAASAENLSALVLLGSALIEAGRPAEALPPLRQAAALSPSNSDVRYNLGLASLMADDPGSAEEAWRQALRLSPRYHDAAANLVDLLQRSGRPVEAAAVLEEARGQGLDGPVLDFLDGRLAFERGERAAARSFLERALTGPLPPALVAEARRLLDKLGRRR